MIINGIPPNTVKFAKVLKERLPNVEILFIYHGSMSQPFHEAEAGLVNDMIKATKEGYVSRIGVVKNGMVESFKAFGIDAVEIWNFPEVSYVLRDGRLALDRSRVNIGVFGSSWVHKNVYAQVVALCGMPDVDLHVLKRPNIPYLEHCQANIVEHGAFLEHDQFVKLIGQMDITLYISLTECFPMTVVESISMGIPSITSSTSAVFSLDPILQDYLVVNELDSPDFIAAKVKRLSANYNDIAFRLWNLIPYIEKKAERQLKIFVENASYSDISSVNYAVPQRLKRNDVITRKPVVAFYIENLFSTKAYSSIEFVMYTVIKEMLEDGHKVIVLSDISDEEMSRWKSMVGERYQNSLFCFTLASLSDRDFRRNDDNLRKSIKIANSFKEIYKKISFDFVEFVDREGLASDLLRKRDLYLPKNVLVSIRVFGSYQVLYDSFHQSLKIEDDLKALFLREQYCLMNADLIVVHNQFQKNLLRLSFGIHPNLIHLSPILTDVVSTELEKITKSTQNVKSSAKKRSIFLVDASWNTFDSMKNMIEEFKNFLNVNKERYPRVRFVFVCSSVSYNKSVILENMIKLEAMVPFTQKIHFEFHKDILDLKTFVLVAQNVRAVVAGQPCDDIGISTHIAGLLNVPLILPNSKLWHEYYNAGDSVAFYEPFDKDSLSKQLIDFTHTPYHQNDSPLKEPSASALDPYVFYNAPMERTDNERAKLLEKQIKLVSP